MEPHVHTSRASAVPFPAAAIERSQSCSQVLSPEKCRCRIFGAPSSLLYLHAAVGDSRAVYGNHRSTSIRDFFLNGYCRESLREPHQSFLPVVVLKFSGVATWVPQDLEILVATSLDSIFFCGLARTMGE
ncbi:hypothetical protein HPB47_001017, partial [Ixodes persulcatus]